MERATSFEQLSGVLGLVTHTFCPIARKKPNTGDMTNQGAYIAIIVSAAALLIATYIRSKFNE